MSIILESTPPIGRASAKLIYEGNLLQIQYEYRFLGEKKAFDLKIRQIQNPDAESLDPKNYTLVWFEEGVGLGLVFKKKIVAIIPPVPNEVCEGYSYFIKRKSGKLYPLSKAVLTLYFGRLIKGKKFWDLWQQKNMWRPIQKKILTTLENKFGQHIQYFAIDGNRWPPRAIAVFESPSFFIFHTLGLLICPQPFVDIESDAAFRGRRIELAMAIEKTCMPSIQEVANFFATVAFSIWDEGRYFLDNHATRNMGVPTFENCPEFKGLLFKKSGIAFPNYQMESVNSLWMIPLTDSEASFAEKQGIGELINVFKSHQLSFKLVPRRNLV